LTLVYAGKSQFVQNMLLTPLSSKYSLYNNVCVQSYQDFTFVTLVGQNTVSSHPFKELKEYNILDAKCIENVVCFIVTKDQIKYDFVYIKQNPLNQAKYTISTYPNCGLGNVNFAIKENGVAIAVLPNDHTVLFSSVWDDLKHNVIQDSCLESDLKVFTRGNDVLLTRGNVVYTLTKK
jgi:hypothetical protein